MTRTVAAMLQIGLFVFITTKLSAQESPTPIDLGQIQGNFQTIFNYYNEDSAIFAVVPPEETTLNAFTNLIYTRGKFSAGIRYESYLPRQVGYPGRFEGTGLGYRYASYTADELSVTVGNFYEQFGNGLVLRAYEERNLGLDNAMDGVKASYELMPGITVKGVYGKMRFNFVDGLVNTEGYVRGVDGEVRLNEALKSLEEAKARISIGGSFVSKYQADDRSDLILPENVGSYAGRVNFQYGNFGANAEYAYKINDPSADNGFIYHHGEAALVNLYYAQKGFSLAFDAKSIDNMSFRPDRTLVITDATVNFLPAMTTQHSYIVAGTFYPYATQLNGEVAYQAEMGYKVPKDSKIGGKYGMDLLISSAQAYTPDTTGINDLDTERKGYKNNFFGVGNNLNFADFHVQIKKKLSKKVKTVFTYYNFVYDNDVITGARLLNGEEVSGTVYSDAFVAEVNWKLKRKHNLRMVAQYLKTDQHQGDWAGLVLEYTVSPNWIFSLLDLYNFGNDIEDNRLHYPFGSVTYVKGSTRISTEYGKRRAGIFCVGGVCRPVPASNGLTLTISSSF